MNEIERRHREILDAQRTLLDEQRQQAEQSERLHYEDLQVAWGRKQVLDRIAALEELRLQEDREQRRREELRGHLRSGLADFPEELRSEWKMLSDEMVTRQEQQITLRRLQSDHEELERICASLGEKLDNDLQKRFTSLYQNLRIWEALPESPLIDLGKLPAFSQLMPLYPRLASSCFHEGVTSSNTLSSRVDDFLAQAAAVQYVAGSLRLPIRLEKEPIIFFIVFFFLIIAVSSSPWSTGSFFLLLSALAFGLTVVVLFRRHFEKDTERSSYLLAAAGFACKVEELVTEATGSYRKGGTLPSQASPEALAPAVTESLSLSWKRLYAEVFKHYSARYARAEPEGLELEECKGRLGNLAREIAVQKSRIEEGAEAYGRSRRRYVYLHDEITRVGREIVEGIRVQGRQITSNPCVSCGELLTSETTVCPFCSSLRGEPLQPIG